MGPITPKMLEIMEIPWELFPSRAEEIGPALDRAVTHMETTGRPYALVMQKGTVAPYALRAAPQVEETRRTARASIDPGSLPAAQRVSRHEALMTVVAHSPPESTAVLATTGFCGRELCAIADRPNQLYMVGSMGCVAPLALGLALARPDLKVLAVDGDGAALMRLGALATIGAYGPSNLLHLLLDNGVHDSTGGQATVSATVSFAAIAAACGYASAGETDQLARVGPWLDSAPMSGPRFLRLLTRLGTPDDLPRPALTPIDVKTRLMQHFGP
jgi:phosphonopyruvate decarboxylase